MMENFPNLVEEIDTPIQEALRVSKRPTPRHTIINMAKVKDRERLFKIAREKQLLVYKAAPIKLSADL